jgi:hypothetical protein
MNRVGRIFSSRVLLLPLVFISMLTGAGVGFWVHDDTNRVVTVTDAQHQITQLSYRGVSGVDAFKLLQKHARITYKHYPFDDYVISIDGVKGNGPRYWTFYVNNKESSVSSNEYITKNSDVITWKLQ